jgi:adenylate kinase family enzyme
MKRIIVVGTTGSGKSKVARALAKKLGHTYIEMDLLFWEPNWTQPKDEVFLKKVEDSVKQDKWVLDGNYGKTHHLTWLQADTVVWIDYPLWLTLFQNISRSLSRSIKRNELWPGTGNKESLIRLFSKDSILIWLLKTYESNRQRFLERMQDPKYKHIKFVHLRSRKEVNNFIA